MQSVGQKLREARLRKHLGLDDVSAETRINLRNLEAIEADDVASISSPFTYRSFVKQFAKAVSLDWTELAAEADANSSRMPKPLVPGENGAPVAPSIPSLRPRRMRKLRWVLSVVSLLLMLAGCSGLYGLWQNTRHDVKGAVLAFLNSSVARVQAKPRPVSPPQTATVHPPGRPLAPAADDGFYIQLSAVENSWLSVVADGKEVFNGILQSSETKVLEGHEEARIRTGNAGGVEVNFNGKPLGTLGRRGQVRTVVFTKDGYEVIQPEARIALTSFRPDAE